MAAEWSKHIKDNDRFRFPTGEVRIDGSKLETKNAFISNVYVSMSTGCEASTCEVTLVLPQVDFKNKKMDLPGDFAKIKLGVEIEIDLGYNVDENPEVETVFVGYISDFSMEVNEEHYVYATIYGMDAKMWMMSSRKFELKKEKKKYSDIVSDLYGKYSAKFKSKMVTISSESEFETPIYQRNESDYEFLCRIADITGALFYVHVGKLYFASAQAYKAVKLNVTPDFGVYNIKVDWSVWNIPDTIKVVSIDRSDFTQVIESEATSSDNIGDGKAATALTSNIDDSNNTITIIDNTVQSAGEATFLAKAKYAERELNLVKGKLSLAGHPKVDPGTGIKLKNFGNPFDNSYIVQGVRHFCDLKDKIYKTEVDIVTNRFNPQTASLF